MRIVPTACGGGFGGKLDLSLQPLLAPRRVAAGPPGALRLQPPRVDGRDHQAPPGADRARLGCDADGRLTALDFEGDFNTGAYASWGPTVANRVPVHATGPYRVPHVHARARCLHHPRAGRRRLPRLRRAAGGDRARDADRRTRRRGSASTAWSSA